MESSNKVFFVSLTLMDPNIPAQPFFTDVDFGN